MYLIEDDLVYFVIVKELFYLSMMDVFVMLRSPSSLCRDPL